MRFANVRRLRVGCHVLDGQYYFQFNIKYFKKGWKVVSNEVTLFFNAHLII